VGRGMSSLAVVWEIVLMGYSGRRMESVCANVFLLFLELFIRRDFCNPHAPDGTSPFSSS
jgi:hypothetical protein